MRNNIAVTPESWAESTAQLKADVAANPMLAAMARAFEPTSAEREQIAAAERLVEEAKASYAAAVIALNRARDGMDRPPSGFEFFKKSKAAYRAQAAAASIPGLREDVEAARSVLQRAIRRLNTTVRSIEQARHARRVEAKLRHAPKLEPVKSRGDAWQAAARKRAA